MHGLDERHAESLVQARADVSVGFPVKFLDLFAGRLTENLHVGRETEQRDEFFHVAQVKGIRAPDETKLRGLGQKLAEVKKCFHKEHLIFMGRDFADAKQTA